MNQKIKHAKDIIQSAISDFKRIAVACSFGKDSMVVVHLARQIDPKIRVFSILTPYKPEETFEYAKKMNEKLGLGTEFFIVSEKVPEQLKDNNVKLLPTYEFSELSSRIRIENGKEIYEAMPDKCCQFLKVEPAKEALKDTDAWICGLRNTEGRTRANFKEIEKMGTLVKVNPILRFTESDVLQYLTDNGIELHPWYLKHFSDGRRYRSLGCAPCTKPIFSYQLERDGRWQNTSKCGGECGIHTQVLK
jgi:phosphoadenosine phosphosulfate reductase